MRNIHVRRDFVHAREGVQQNRIGFGFVLQQIKRNFVVVGGRRQFALPLVAGFGVIGLHRRLDEDDIRLADDIADVVGKAEIQTHSFEIFFVVVGHFHAGRRYKGDGAIELSQRVPQRVHRAHPHIADGDPAQPVDGLLFPKHGVEVGENLRGMFAPAVAAVDDGNRRPFCRLVGRALLEVAHHNHVAVIFQHLDGILNGFLIEIARAGHLRIGKTRHMTAQAVHRGFVRQAGARRRLIKRRHQSLFRQQIRILTIAGNRLQFFGNFEHTEKLVAFKIFQRKNVTSSKTTHFKKPPKRNR